MSDGALVDAAQEGIPLKRYAAVLFRYKVLIAAIFVVGTAAGVVGALLLVRPMSVYDGRQEILLRSPALAISPALSDEGRASVDQALLVEAEITNLRRLSILEKVVTDCGLSDQQKRLQDAYAQSVQGQFWRWLSERFSFLAAAPEFKSEQDRYLASALNTLRSDLTIRTASRSFSPQRVLLAVEYANPDRDKVRDVIEAFVRRANAVKEAEYGEALSFRRDLLDRRYLTVERAYNAVRKELTALYTEAGIAFNSEPAVLLRRIQERRAPLEAERGPLRTDLRQREAQMRAQEAALAAMERTGASVVVHPATASPQAQRLTRTLDALYMRLVSLETETMIEGQSFRIERENQITNIRQRIKELEDQLEDMRESREIRAPEVLAVERELRMNTSVAEEIRKALAAVEKQLEALDAEQRKAEAIMLNIESVRERFLAASSRYEQAAFLRDERRLAEELFAQMSSSAGTAGGMASVADQASPVQAVGDVTVSRNPRALHRTGRTKFVLAAMFASLAAGLGLAFVLGVVLDASLHTPQEAEKKLGLPVLAAVPLVHHWRLG